MKRYILTLWLLCSICMLYASNICFSNPAGFTVNSLSAALKTQDTIYFSIGTFDGGNSRITINASNGYVNQRVVLIGNGMEHTILNGISFAVEGAYACEFKQMTIQENTTSGQNGGAIFAQNLTSLLLDRVNIKNSSAVDGGAIALYGTLATIKNSSLTNNTASSTGGAIYVSPSASSNATLNIENSLIADNMSNNRGAVYIDGISQSQRNVKANIENTTVAFNRSKYGGGIYARGSKNTRLFILHSTIAYNNATSSSVPVNGIYFEGNTFEMTNSIVSMNGTSSASPLAAKDIAVTATTGNIGYCFTGTGDVSGEGSQTGMYEDLKLAQALENRGGAIEVLPLLSGSPAIDKGTANTGKYEPLDIYYVDGKPVGIVFYVDGTGKNGLVVSADEIISPWATGDGVVASLGFAVNMSRESAMANIQTRSNWQIFYPIFAWTAQKGENWYVPTADDYAKLYTAWNGSSSSTPDPVAQKKFNDLLIQCGGTAIVPETESAGGYSSCTVKGPDSWGNWNSLVYFSFADGSYKAQNSKGDEKHLRAVFPFRGSDEIDLWELDFEDNFDGTSLNTNNWSCYYSPGHDNHGLRRPEAFSVEDGNVVVTAKMLGSDIVSGGMYHKKNYLYGKFEFRVMTERDPSSIMSGVVLTWPRTEKWPDDGEIDIYETGPGGSRDNFWTYVHYGTLQNHKSPGYQHATPAREWHIMACEWTPSELRFYRDGNLVWTRTDPAAIPSVGHHLCIQLDASKDGTLSQPVKMYVDWVKIYKYNGE